MHETQSSGWQRVQGVLPSLALVASLICLGVWFTRNPVGHFQVRAPGTDHAPDSAGASTKANPVLSGTLVTGPGRPATLPGAWPAFRGADGSGAVSQSPALARSWDSSGPRELWGVDLGEGYAGPAILNGRVYVMDYDREKKQDALRCLSLDDGREIWRFAYPMSVKRNHGMTRTTPSVTDKFVVAMAPKCHVVCLDSVSGELKWSLDLVKDFGTTIPQWYAGQCPLIDGNRVILAPGGPEALVMAVELETGKVLWRTPNPRDWKMTHVSLVPVEFGGHRHYVYCASQGVVGVDAKDGALLWETTDWKISIATVPTPVVVDTGRIFFSGGYNAGSLMLKLTEEGGKIVPKTEFRLDAQVFGATQHTPILHQGLLYGTRADGRFVCLGTDGKIVWSSDAGTNFGIGPFLLADGRFFVMNDSGRLTMVEASTSKYAVLAEAQVLKGHDSWGPLALAGGRLLARDFSRMVCLDVSSK